MKIKNPVLYLLANLILILSTYLIFIDIVLLPMNVFLLFIISRSISGLFSIFIFYEVYRLQGKHKTLLSLVLAGSSFILGYIMESLSILLLNSKSNYFLFSKYMFMISQYLITLGPLLLMYFIVSFFKKEPGFWEFSPLLLDIMIESIYQPMELVLGRIKMTVNDHVILFWVYNPIAFWINIVYFISILWLLGYITYLILKSRKDILVDNTRHQQKIFLFGIYTVFLIAPLVFSFQLFITDQVLKFIWVAIVGRSFVIIGLSIFVLSYINSAEKIDFFQPQPLDSLYLLRNDNEIVEYFRNFRINTGRQLASLLVSNLDDINSMISEILNTDTKIQSIDITNHEVLVHQLENHDCTLILIVVYQTSAIMERFNLLVSRLDIMKNLSSIDSLVDTVFGV